MKPWTRLALKVGVVVALVIGCWMVVARLCQAQEKTAQRSQLQASALQDVVCIYDQAGEKLWDSLQKNIYGALRAGVASPLCPCEGGMLFSPTDRKDHLSSPYVDLIPCRAGKVRCLTVSLAQPSNADGSKLSIALQRDGFVDLTTIATVDEKGKPAERAGPIEVPEDARQFRIVIQSPAQVPSLLPSAIRVEAGYFSQSSAVGEVNRNADPATAILLGVGILALSILGYVRYRAGRSLTGLAKCLWAGQQILALPREIVCSRWGTRSPRPLLSTAALWLVVMGVGLALNREYFQSFNKPVPNDQHAMLCLEMAIHHQRFGCRSHIYRETSFADMLGARSVPPARIFRLLPDKAAMLSQKLRDLPEHCNDSIEDYARNLMPWVNNENSLMLIDQAVLWLMPDITLAGMIGAHLLLKVACLAVFILFLLRVGFSPLFSLGVFHVALVLLQDVNQLRPVSLYPFLLPCTLLLVAMPGLTLSLGLHRRLWQHAPALVVIGFIGAFLTNLRTSYFPVVVAMPLLYVVIASLDLRRTLGRSVLQTSLLAAVSLACFFAGSKAFTATFISPLEKRGKDNFLGQNYSYHVVAHPLVLLLAVPPNELARREGIEYDDAYGLKLAQRIDPTVTYLGKNYDNALFVYYFKLWLYYPSEMLHLYHAKSQLAASSTSQATPVSDTRGARLFRVLALPLRNCANWLIYVALFTAVAVIPLFLTGFLTIARAFALSALATGGVLLFLELAWLTSNFCMIYNAFLYFWFLFLGLLCYQMITDGLFHAIRWGARAVTTRLYQWRTSVKPTRTEEFAGAGVPVS